MKMASAKTVVSGAHGTKRKRLQFTTRHASLTKLRHCSELRNPCKSTILICAPMKPPKKPCGLNLSNIMDDVLRHIFLFLPASDLLSSVVLVQRQWNEVIDHASFWRDIAANENPHVIDIYNFINEKDKKRNHQRIHNTFNTTTMTKQQSQHVSIKNLLCRELKDSMDFISRPFWDGKIRLAEELPFPGKQACGGVAGYCGDQTTTITSVTSSCREILLHECRFLVRLYCPLIDPINAVSTELCKPQIDKYAGFQFDGYNGFDFEVDIKKFRETIDLSSPQPLRIAIYLIHRGTGGDDDDGRKGTTGSCLWVDTKFMKCNLCGMGDEGAYGCWLFDELHPTTNGIYLWQKGKQLKILFCTKRVCDWKHNDEQEMNTWLKRALE